MIVIQGDEKHRIHTNQIIENYQNSSKYSLIKIFLSFAILIKIVQNSDSSSAVTNAPTAPTSSTATISPNEPAAPPMPATTGAIFS